MAVKTSTRVPMSIKQRAKQFMMFDAMKGLTEAIADKERTSCSQIVLSEDKIEEINRKLNLLEVGDFVTISFYCQYGKQYRQITGKVKKFDLFWKAIQIEDITIYFTEIEKITIHQ